MLDELFDNDGGAIRGGSGSFLQALIQTPSSNICGLFCISDCVERSIQIFEAIREIW